MDNRLNVDDTSPPKSVILWCENYNSAGSLVRQELLCYRRERQEVEVGRGLSREKSTGHGVGGRPHEGRGK